MKSYLSIAPGWSRKHILGLLPLGVNSNNPAIVRLFQEPDDWIVGVCPLIDHVFLTDGFSEMPDSSS